MTAIVYTPRDYQRAITDHMLCNPRVNVWSGMGTGKTVATLTALDILINVLGEVKRALVVAPLRVARTTWPAEVRKWQHLRHLKVEAATGDPHQRRAAIFGSAQVVTINYENLVWLIEQTGVDGFPFDMIVADESTKLKGFRLRQGVKRGQALGRVAHTIATRWVNLTGTPSPNGVQDLWGQCWFVDAGKRLGRTYSAFEARWFSATKPHRNATWFEKKVLPHAQPEIEALLRDVTITVSAADHLDLPPLVRNLIEVDLPPAAAKVYRDLEREFFAELESKEEIEALNAAALSVKCLQVANGAAYADDLGNWAPIHDAKIEALESIIEEAAGMPVLVAYHFKSDLARLKKAFPKGRELDAKSATIEAWNRGQIPLMFAHPASAGHGLNLQDGGNILAFFGLWWNLEEHDQIIERIGPTRQAQAGHNRPCFVHYITARGTIDATVLTRLEGKRSVQELLLEAMKEKRNG